MKMCDSKADLFQVSNFFNESISKDTSEKQILTQKIWLSSKYLVFYFHTPGYSVAPQDRKLVHEKNT